VKNTFLDFSPPTTPTVQKTVSCNVPIGGGACPDNRTEGKFVSQVVQSVCWAELSEEPDSTIENESVLAELGTMIECAAHQLATAEAALVAAKDAVATVQAQHQILLREWRKRCSVIDTGCWSGHQFASAPDAEESSGVDRKESDQTKRGAKISQSPEMTEDDTDGRDLVPKSRNSQLAVAGRSRTSRPREAARGSPSNNDGILFHSRFYVGIEADEDFNVVRRLVGTGGKNMKHINSRSGGKVWIRGKGSRHPEGDERVESTDPLMMIVTARTTKNFQVASEMVAELLKRLHDDYIRFCTERGWSVPMLSVQQEIQRGPKQASR